MAAHGRLAALYSGAQDPQGQAAWYDRAYRTPGARLSYTQATLAEIGGRVVGVNLTYPGAQEPALTAPLQARAARPLERESQDGDAYLDTLCVHPAHRGHGIGSALLKAFTATLPAGCERHALLVDPENEGARRLYARFAFTPDGIWTLYGEEYLRMVREGSGRRS